MDACDRCGATGGVRPVTYTRGQQLLHERWCERCKEERLVPRRSRHRVGPRRQVGGALAVAAALAFVVLMALLWSVLVS